MQCIIESAGLQLDNKLQNLAQSKFENFEKIYNRVTKCRIIMKKESDDRKKVFHVEAQLTVPQKMLFAHEQAETFEIALHKVVDDLTHQLCRYKEEREEVR